MCFWRIWDVTRVFNSSIAWYISLTKYLNMSGIRSLLQPHTPGWLKLWFTCSKSKTSDYSWVLIFAHKPNDLCKVIIKIEHSRILYIGNDHIIRSLSIWWMREEYSLQLFFSNGQDLSVTFRTRRRAFCFIFHLKKNCPVELELELVKPIYSISQIRERQK